VKKGLEVSTENRSLCLASIVTLFCGALDESAKSSKEVWLPAMKIFFLEKLESPIQLQLYLRDKVFTQIVKPLN